MLVAGELALDSGGRDLKIIALLYRVGFVERAVNSAAEILAVGYTDAALLVYIYSEIPGNSLFLESDIPDRKPQLFSDGSSYLPHGGYGVAALAFACHRHISFFKKSLT